MAIAATISVPLTSPTCRTLASLSNLSRRSTLPTPQRTFKYPNLRLVASSMSTETAVKTSSASFLHRKEFGFLHFAKYHGLGNDFILIDNRDSSEPRISAGKAVQLCDRNFGVGADGVIFVLPGINGTDYTIRIFNSDGSEPEMCGNGVRCFAKFVSQLKNLHGRHRYGEWSCFLKVFCCFLIALSSFTPSPSYFLLVESCDGLLGLFSSLFGKCKCYLSIFGIVEIPQFLFDAGFYRDGRVIGITQPRRVAAVTVAKRVAEECGVELSQKVGYSVRFDDATSGSTRIKYMTDGLLLRESLLDPYLSKYSVIIVDEAHERTVHTDVLMGLLKNVQLARSSSVSGGQGLKFGNKNMNKLSEKENDQSGSFLKKPCHEKYAPLKLIIMSASLDARAFSEYFGGAKAVHIQGRQFPVDIFYTRDAETDYLDASLITIFQIHLEEGPGDILVFLTGQEEIESVERLINEKLPQLPQESQKLLVVPIFAALPSEQQMRVFAPAPSGFRKDLVCKTFSEFWFEEPPASQTQVFGDGSNVPLEIVKKTEQIVEMLRGMPNNQLLVTVIKRNLSLDFLPQSAKAIGVNPVSLAIVRKRCELMCKCLLEKMLQVDEMNGDGEEVGALPYVLVLHAFCLVDPTLCAPASNLPNLLLGCSHI